MLILGKYFIQMCDCYCCKVFISYNGIGVIVIAPTVELQLCISSYNKGVKVVGFVKSYVLKQIFVIIFRDKFNG